MTILEKLYKKKSVLFQKAVPVKNLRHWALAKNKLFLYQLKILSLKSTIAVYYVIQTQSDLDLSGYGVQLLNSKRDLFLEPIFFSTSEVLGWI